MKKPDSLKVFYNQAHENLRTIERNIMRSKDLLNLFAEYQNEITRDNLTETLKIVAELNRWIIDNAMEINLKQE